MYTGLMDSARQAGAKLQNVVQKVVRVLQLCCSKLGAPVPADDDKDAATTKQQVLPANQQQQRECHHRRSSQWASRCHMN